MSEEIKNGLNEEGGEEEELSTIVLTTEDGTEEEYEFIDLIEYKDGYYCILLSLDETDDDVIILEVKPNEEDPETDMYLTVDDDEILNAVFDIFKERYKDVFDFAE